MLRRLEIEDMDAAAAVHRASFDQALPTLAGRHMPDEDRWYFPERVLPSCLVWGRFEAGKLAGIVAFREGWIDHLYVLPATQGRGIGSSLIRVAQSQFDCLSLWTFERNLKARSFYERRGFLAVQETDGSRNEEKEPDIMYTWRR